MTPPPSPQRCINDADERAELVASARGLVTLLAEDAAATEVAGNPTPRVVAAMRESGFYTLTAPRRFGGREAGVRTVIEVYAELGRGCGSSAWTGKIHCGAAFMASLFDDKAREDVWGGDSRATVSGSFNGSSTARVVKDGVIASGEWHYASGVRQAGWVICTISVDGTGARQPDVRLALIPTNDITIENTWNMAGMEGTGSDSFAVTELFVPSHRTISLALAMWGSARTWSAGEPVYQASLPSMLAISMAGPVIGMAQGALEQVLAMLQKGRPLSGSTYSNAIDSPSVQESVAAAISLIDSARMHAYRAADDIEAASIAGVALDVSARARVRMDTGIVMRRCREALDRILDAGGASSFARTNPLQRFWRDLTVASRHAAVSPLLNGEIYGRAVLGVEKQVTHFV